MDNRCTCPFCREGKYNSEDYYVDMSFLKKERPVGVSGLLRVKNDAEFLSDCMESCIDALDELIICYQDCTDNAPEIILEKQQKYPDKIRVYYYAPPVFCHGLTEEAKKNVFSLPDSSIHKLCNYYNYTLSKSTYRYVMKIDSDQIYFTDKLKRYCDAYREKNKVTISSGDYFAKYYKDFYIRLMIKYPVLHSFDLFSKIPYIRHLIIRKYEKYVIKEVINNKYAVSMSGINIGYEQGNLKICRLDHLLFNGEADHLIFCITEDTFYTTFTGYKNPIEIMRYNKRILPGGWFWYHLQCMKVSSSQKTKEWITLTLKFKWNIISDLSYFRKQMWLFFGVYERNIPGPEQLLKETVRNMRKRKS
ncbi:hypothetical protein H8S77_19080 [Parabacteroides sp. BX2]|jgi:hypothetical protein|uniref:Glycosyltransferase family 2 protein n=1 Tax=Parabacteroides segnis TaxID=2763058 RepID=A0ABR7E5E4_9BACT|nr:MULTISPECIES: hypothetical protein [Parabacteroides]MBC5644986.1 hypothetical protein [Parabacteroides segnis]MCM0712689.1 hypothetical protein [Parabacteroides sp. TA-V-105]